MADQSVDIRSAVFGALHPSLDPFLASPANVPIIVAATNDESLEVRFQPVYQYLVGTTRPYNPRRSTMSTIQPFIEHADVASLLV